MATKKRTNTKAPAGAFTFTPVMARTVYNENQKILRSQGVIAQVMQKAQPSLKTSSSTSRPAHKTAGAGAGAQA
jgi:hypothetical protein